MRNAMDTLVHAIENPDRVPKTLEAIKDSCCDSTGSSNTWMHNDKRHCVEFLPDRGGDESLAGTIWVMNNPETRIYKKGPKVLISRNGRITRGPKHFKALAGQ